MGNILVTDQDYFAIRYALGLEDDADRLLTDDVIDALPHLPAAEFEAIRRFPSFWSTLMGNDPRDMNQMALKMGVVARCCANLTARLEITIPLKGSLTQFGDVERNKIDWLKKKKAFLDDANLFWGYLSQVLNPHQFPTALTTAHGRLYLNDPGYWKAITGFSIADLAGYTSINGIVYAF